MPIPTGNIARGEDFFARTIELQDLWEALAGNHLILAGPRRLGKSSLLARLAEQAEERGLLPRYVDVEGIDSAADFVTTLDAALPDATLSGWMKKAGAKTGTWFARLHKIDLKLPGDFGGGIELQALPAAAWTTSARNLQARLADKPVLLLIDEFSVFLEKLIARDPREAEFLLAWLRIWRLSGSVCRFVYSGSIGVNSLLERYNLTTRLNDVHEYKLGPFRSSEARDMLATQAQRKDWTMHPDTNTATANLINIKIQQDGRG